jgi:hypothetical protein
VDIDVDAEMGSEVGVDISLERDCGRCEDWEDEDDEDKCEGEFEEVVLRVSSLSRASGSLSRVGVGVVDAEEETGIGLRVRPITLSLVDFKPCMSISCSFGTDTGRETGSGGGGIAAVVAKRAAIGGRTYFVRFGADPDPAVEDDPNPDPEVEAIEEVEAVEDENPRSNPPKVGKGGTSGLGLLSPSLKLTLTFRLKNDELDFLTFASVSLAFDLDFDLDFDM